MAHNMTLAGFMAHTAAAIAHLKQHEHHAMERAAKLVETEAKAEIGTYQSAAGPFAGWAELAESTKDDRVKLGFSENDPGLRAGDMRDSIDHAVGDREAAVGSNDQHLEWFELGTAKQPPRSVLGIAAVHKGPEVAREIGHSVTMALIGPGVVGGRLTIP